MAKALNTCVIAVSGTHTGFNQAKIERIVTTNGGTFSKTVNDTVTHLVTTEGDFEKKSNKVLQAHSVCAKIVKLDWLHECVSNKKKVDEAEYLLGSHITAAATPAVSANPSPEPEAEPAKTNGRTTRKRATKSESASKGQDDKDVEPEPEAEKTTGRNTRKRTVIVKSDPEAEEEAEQEAEPEPPAKKSKKAPAKGKGKGKGKAAAVKDEEPADEDVVMQDVEQEEEKKEEEVKEEPKMKTVIRKGRAPVDELSGLAKSHHVYVDSSGVVWDACLNQTQLAANNNKFYYIQLLENDSGKTYSTFTHWGRVGERGQCKMVSEDTSLQMAEYAFRKQFKSKTGKDWDNRDNAHGGVNKYAYLARNYDDDDDDDKDEAADQPSSTAETIKIPDPTISKPLQSLMELIFNNTYMQQSMASLSYDARKLPLGKLSKDTIMRGYSVLKEIGELLAKPATVSTRSQLMDLSGRYYTVIPHDFGRNTPPVIDTPQRLKRETDLVENLSDMKITAEIMALTTGNHSIHPYDQQFNSLGLNEALPLDHNSQEFKYLEAYLYKTQGSTHHLNLKVEEIFRVARSSEEDRWQASGMSKLTNLGDNRKLLWHGSRTTNFSGILSQGLRIAPPEAPVNGYMFDKGIYLADIATKSANYCCAYNSGNTGLLLLCEAQLGDPMLELTNADYHAATKCKKAGKLATKGLGLTAPTAWEDAGMVNDNLKGVMMPKVTGKEKNITGPSGVNNAYLQYNEYIVYDVAQVKIRYMFRCKFGN